jgi:hypothetical protein
MKAIRTSQSGVLMTFFLVTGSCIEALMAGSRKLLLRCFGNRRVDFNEFVCPCTVW